MSMPRVTMPGLPARIGPVEFEQFGAKWVAVRCPAAFDELMRLKGGVREAGGGEPGAG